MLHEQFLNEVEKAFTQVVPKAPEGLYDPIRYGLGMGGKRIRPILLLQTYSLYRFDWTRAVPVAAALEIYHNHTLLHDDVMDRADMRRGKPSVWRKWDESTAILSGDAMLISSVMQLVKEKFPNQQAVLQLCLTTMREICEGQQLDMDFEKREDVLTSEYMEMIRLKTAVLFACALQCGAMLAEAPQDHWRELYQFGINLGLAFQLQDDYLDCYGTPDLFGKNIGGDIMEGKKTYLLTRALEIAEEPQKSELLRLLRDEKDAKRKVDGVLDIYNKLGIPHLCEAEIASLFLRAKDTLDHLAVDDKAKQELWRYAESLLHRKA